MTSSGWRPGDLGRSKFGSEVRPQFEAISASKNGVVLWHHMRPALDLVPVLTFRRDYTPDWKLATAVPDHNVTRGQVYSMDQDLPFIRAAEAPRRFRIQPAVLLLQEPQLSEQQTWEHETGLHIRSRRLRVRRVQHNFASCEVMGEKSLVIIPVEWLERWGHIYNSLWDHLESDWSL